MSKIPFIAFEKMMSYDVIKNHACIEIGFSVENHPIYHACWLGKTVNKEKNKATYWFGLVEDGSQAYDYDSFEQFVNSRVFSGRSIKDIWSYITLSSIDGCNINERLPFYLGVADGPIRGPAMPM